MLQDYNAFITTTKTTQFGQLFMALIQESCRCLISAIP